MFKRILRISDSLAPILVLGLILPGPAHALRAQQSPTVRGQLQAGLEDQNAAGLESNRVVREVTLKESQVLARYDHLFSPRHITPAAGGNGIWVVHHRPKKYDAWIQWLRVQPDHRDPATFRWSSLFLSDYTFPLRSFPVALPPDRNRQEVYVLSEPNVFRRLELVLQYEGDRVSASMPGHYTPRQLSNLGVEDARGAVYDRRADKLVFLFKGLTVSALAYAMSPSDWGSMKGGFFALPGHSPVALAADERRGYIWILDNLGALSAYAWRGDSYGYSGVGYIDLLSPLIAGKKLKKEYSPSPWFGGHLAADPVSGKLLATRPEAGELWVIDPGALRDSKFTPTITIIRLSPVLQEPSESRPIPVAVLPESGNVVLGDWYPGQLLVLPKVNELLRDDASDWARTIQELVQQRGTEDRQAPPVWGIRLEGNRFRWFDRSVHSDSGGGWVVVDLEPGDLTRLEQEGHLSLEGRRRRDEFQSDQARQVDRGDFKRATIELPSQETLETRLTGESTFPLELRYGTSPPQDIRGEHLKLQMGPDDLTWLALVPLSEDGTALFILKTNPIGGQAELLEGEVKVENGTPKFHPGQVRSLAGRTWMGLTVAPDSNAVYTWNSDANELAAIHQIPTATAGPQGAPQAGLEEPEERIRRMLKELAGGPTVWQVVGPSVIRKFPALTHLIGLMDRLAVEDGTPEGRAVLLELLRGQRPPVDYVGYHTFFASEYEEFRAAAQEVGMQVENARMVSGLPEPEQILRQILAGWAGRPVSEIPAGMAQALAADLELLGQV